MTKLAQRMVDGSRQPNAKSVRTWLGAVHYKRWRRLLKFIETNYPGVFSPEWLFGGKKYGWGLRFKKSRSFCTLIPERNRLTVLIVFGGKEREKAEAILHQLSPRVRDAYLRATTYHDGKWLAIPLDRDKTVEDLCRLLSTKRRLAPAALKRRRPNVQ